MAGDEDNVGDQLPRQSQLMDASQVKTLIGEMMAQLFAEQGVSASGPSLKEVVQGEGKHKTAVPETHNISPGELMPRQLHLVAPKPSPIWTHDVELWFGTLEAQFMNARITSQETKYYYVLSVLTPELARIVPDMVKIIPPKDPYDLLKQSLITRLGDSSTARIRKVLSQMDLGDKRPSQLLREMQATAMNAFPGETLQVLWDAKLPTKVRTVIAGSVGKLDDVAQLADKVWEACAEPNLMAVSHSPGKTDTAPLTKPQSSIERLESWNLELQAQINELTQAFKRASYGGRSRTNSPSAGSHFRQRSGSRSRSRVAVKGGVCWYHYRFNEKAVKCVPDCKWYDPTKFDQKK